MHAGPMILYRWYRMRFCIDNLDRENAYAIQGRLHFFFFYLCVFPLFEWSILFSKYRTIDSSLVCLRSLITIRGTGTKGYICTPENTARSLPPRYRPCTVLSFSFSLFLARYARWQNRLDQWSDTWWVISGIHCPPWAKSTSRDIQDLPHYGNYPLLRSYRAASVCCILCRAASLMTG